MPARRKKLTWIERTAAANTKKERKALSRRAKASEGPKIKKLAPSKPTYIEQVAAAKTPSKRAALKRRTAKTEAPRSARLKTLKPSGKRDVVARASEAHYKRRAAANAIKVKHDAENIADEKQARKASLTAGGVDFSVAAGIASALGTTTISTAKAFAHDPIKQTKFLGKGAKEAARGAIGAVEAVPVIGKDLITKGKSERGGEILKGIGADYKRRLGAGYRGEKGAIKKQTARQRKEGSFPEVLDLATFAAGPTGQGLAQASRAAAKTGTVARSTSKPARALKAVARSSTKDARPKLRDAANVATTQRTRKGIIGATGAAANDAVRATVQKRAVKKSVTPARPKLNPRAAAKTTPLPLRRSAVGPDEVVGLSRRTSGHRARKRISQDVEDAKLRTGTIADRELGGRKGPRDHPGAGTMRSNYKTLPEELHPAVGVASQLGIRSAEGARAILPARIEKLEAELARNPAKATEQAVELPVLKQMLKDAEVFDNPDVRRVADIEDARAARLVGKRQGLSPQRSEAARIEFQAETLGVKRKLREPREDFAGRVHAEIDAREQAILATARKGGAGARTRARNELEALHSATGEVARRDATKASPTKMNDAARVLGLEPRRKVNETHAEYAARAAEARGAAGLAEPGYRTSLSNDVNDAPVVSMGDASSEVANPLRERTGENFRMGRQNMDPRLQEAQLGRAVQRGEQVVARADILEREGKMFGSRTEAQKWLDANNVVRGSSAGSAGRRGMDDALIVPIGEGRVGKVPPAIGAKPEGDYVKTDAVAVVPRRVVDEFSQHMRGPSPVGMMVNKAVGVQNAALLAASPAWLQFQLIADGGAALVGGGLGRTIRASRAYRQADDATRETWDVLIGGGPANDALMWDADARVGQLTHALENTPVLKRFVDGRNPLTTLLRADAAKNRTLRRGVLLAKLERDARTVGIDSSLRKMQPPQKWLRDVVSKPDPQEVARLLAENPQHAIAAGEHVQKIMGNFSSYTAAERASIRRIIPFYGFMRYSLRLAFYTLPIEHPLVGGIVAELGRINAEEAKDIIGPDLPYGLSQFYTDKGKKSVDFARASPVMNSLVTVDKPGQLAGLMPPLASIGLNYIAGKNLFKDRDYKVSGSLNPNLELTQEDRARIALHETLNIFGLVRDLDNAQDSQSDDSLPWDRKKLVPVDPNTAANFKKKPGTVGSRFLEKTFPLASPIQDSEDMADRGKQATRKKLESKKTRATDKARRDALQNDPVAKAIQEAKIIKAQAKKQAEVFVDPVAQKIIDEANAERARLGLPALRR